MLRHSEHCSGIEQIERVQPELHHRLEAIHDELLDTKVEIFLSQLHGVLMHGCSLDWIE